MDLVYDHIQEDAYTKERAAEKDGNTEQPKESLEADLQDAYKAISASPWGMKIGGFLGNVVKQGGEVYTQGSKELAEVGEDATKGFSYLRDSISKHTRALSLNTAEAQASGVNDDSQTTPTKSKAPMTEEEARENETVLSRLRAEAAKRLRDLQKAEDAADEALLRFGTNVRDFLKEAISIAPPDSEQGSTILFESKDAHGRRVIHASRLDAQLHVIHTTTAGFERDPATDEYKEWAKDFDVEKKTADISKDLTAYPELRDTMEKLVPDKIAYADFWRRYYFLRHGLDTAEARRRDLLKAASAEDEVGWGDDSDDEAAPAPTKGKTTGSGASSATIPAPDSNRLKPTESRKSNDEKSQADSEASYDVVGATSGVTSQAPNSPKESKKGDDSDDDWE